MKEDIEWIIKRTKFLESSLKIFGLENLQKCNDMTNKFSDVQKFELEMELSDLKSNVTKMESNTQKLLKEIEESKKTIELLNECLGGKLNVAEMNNASEKRQILIQKLKNRQFSEDHPILRVVQKIKELDDFST